MRTPTGFFAFLAALSLGLAAFAPGTVRATVSIEFQLGAVEVPTGALGVLVADTGNNGFEEPASVPGVPLEPGAVLGSDDVIVAVFSERDLPAWAPGRGFAGVFAALDYETLGVEAGQALVLYVFPDRAPGAPVRSGEPYVAYRTGELGELSASSSMGFELPPDGGAYLLAALGAAQGGSAWLGEVDITPVALSGGTGNAQRSLAAAARHTYYFEMSGAGPLAITGSGNGPFLAELYNHLGALVAVSDGSGGFVFERELEAGLHRLVLSREDGGLDAMDYSLDFASEFIRFVRPDVTVGPSLSRQIGAGVYSPTRQRSVLVSRNARRVRGFATVSNRGDLQEALAVRATRGNRLFRVVYHGASGNLTAALVSGTYRTEVMDEASPAQWLRTTVTPNRRRLLRFQNGSTVVLRRAYQTTIQADSTSSPGIGDAAILRVRTR